MDKLFIYKEDDNIDRKAIEKYREMGLKELMYLAYQAEFEVLEHLSSPGKDSAMSLGYLGRIKLQAADENLVLYSYCGENWNDKSSNQGNRNDFDGEIAIHIPRVSFPADLSDAIASGNVEIIRPCKAESTVKEFARLNRLYFAEKLLHKVFESYEKSGIWPETEGFIV